MMAQASLKALEIMLEEPWRVATLQERSRYMLDLARRAGLDTGEASGYAVIPVMVGSSLTAAILADLLHEDGILTLPIIYPGVEEGKARLRFFVSCRHTPEHIERAIASTARLLPRAREKAASFTE